MSEQYSVSRGRFQVAIPNDNDVNLPVVFLRGLHERGYSYLDIAMGALIADCETLLSPPHYLEEKTAQRLARASARLVLIIDVNK